MTTGKEIINFIVRDSINNNFTIKEETIKHYCSEEDSDFYYSESLLFLHKCRDAGGLLITLLSYSNKENWESVIIGYRAYYQDNISLIIVSAVKLCESDRLIAANIREYLQKLINVWWG